MNVRFGSASKGSVKGSFSWASYTIGIFSQNYTLGVLRTSKVFQLFKLLHQGSPVRFGL